MSDLRACKGCSFLTMENNCPKCGSATYKEWQGYVVVVDAAKSEIAKRLGISTNGKYALKVR
jgi:DNA-directed RNA polymerase subunit E"